MYTDTAMRYGSFIDEPTTSLDSTVALSLMKVLKKLPQLHGVTVCCSIHQPGPRIFELFHSLILMSIGGRLAYNGPTDGLVNYFSNEFDYDIPRPDLVAEWVLDISVGIKDDSTENKRRNQIRYGLMPFSLCKYFEFIISLWMCAVAFFQNLQGLG